MINCFYNPRLLKMDKIRDFDDADTLSIDTLALERDVEEERTREINQLVNLSKKVSFLHTSVLYYRNPKSKKGDICYEAWRSLVKNIGSTAYCWKDLGHYLGVPNTDLDYIMHSVKEDQTDVVLKLFLQDEKATLDKIVEALTKMQRFNILKAIDHPLTDLAACFFKDNSKSDTGYHSQSEIFSPKEIISFSNLPSNFLPSALRKKANDDEMQKPPTKHIIDYREKPQSDLPTLLLTYTEDGLDTALRIQNKVKDWPEELQVSVVTLNANKDDLLQSPEKSIKEAFEKADFIVPIITTGYFNDVVSKTSGALIVSDNLDCKYANFLYNLIVNHYIYVTGCLNEKVRSVFPEDSDVRLLLDIPLYPHLMPWTHESFFDKQFQAFFKDLSNFHD